jgi:PAS domain S-box-containing protein
MKVMMSVSFILKIAALLNYVILVLITLRSNSTRQVKLFFSIYLSGMTFWQFSSLMVNFTSDPQTAIVWYNLIFSGSGLFSVLFFPLTRALLNIKKQRVLAVVSYAVCLFVVATGILGVPITHVAMGESGYYVPVLDSIIVAIVGLIPLFFWGLGVVNLIRGLAKKKSLMEKNRIKYVLGGALVMIIGAFSNTTPLKNFPIDIVCNLVNALLISYAVIRHRLLDIRTFIFRSITYTLTTGTLIVGYSILVLIVQDAVNKYLMPLSPLINVLLIIGLIFFFLPIRNRLQPLIDRLFFRSKYDYRVAVEKFSTDINSFHNIDEVLSYILATVQSTIKIDMVFATLLDRRKGDYRLVKSASHVNKPVSVEGDALTPRLKEYFLKVRQPVLKDEITINPKMAELAEEYNAVFEKQGVFLIVPFILKDQLLGTLHCGQKLSGTIYIDDDLRFLTTIANQSSTAIDNAMVYTEIERRLGIQTLLLILSETFRSDKSFGEIMSSVVKILSDFLSLSHCHLVCFDQERETTVFSFPDLEPAMADLLKRHAREALEATSTGGDEASYFLPGLGARLLAGKALPPDHEAFLLASVCIPLRQHRDIFGILIIPNKVTGRDIEEIDMDFLRTIRAIISQGIMLHRTIINLINMKDYNEKIINGMNKIGDALTIVDLEGKIRNVNEAMCALLEYRKEELIGMDMGAVSSAWPELFSRESVPPPEDRKTVSNYELSYRTKSGNEIPMLFSGSIIYNETGKIEGILGIARDISTRKQAEDARKKELLLKEIHHRVKNNLQVISSLLSLQSRYMNDEKVKMVFKESQSRIRSIALIHENLYLSKDLAGIDFNGYVKDLIADIFFTYGADRGRISLNVDIPPDVSLNMDQAIPCGLIINELVTNSLKYAFPGNERGRIFIKLSEEKKAASFTLVVGDDGVGLPDVLDLNNLSSLGLKLVFTLIKQLNGVIEIQRDKGAVFTLRINQRPGKEAPAAFGSNSASVPRS